VIHELKTWPGPYQAARDGNKTYEIRRADRRYGKDDILILREWTPPSDPTADGEYTGSFGVWIVSHITEGGAWGIPSELVVMGIRTVPLFLVIPGSRLGAIIERLKVEGDDLPEPKAASYENQVCPGCDACDPNPKAPPRRDGMPGGRARFN